MGKTTGKNNNNWKGGRSITPDGYVLIRVGIHHHLSDVRGYAYEHRLVAEQKFGRRLKPGELVHHIDGNKQNNNPENLEICTSTSSHRTKHRKPGSRLRNPGEPNPVVQCKCGCKKRFSKFDVLGRPRLFVSGHNLASGARLA